MMFLNSVTTPLPPLENEKSLLDSARMFIPTIKFPEIDSFINWIKPNNTFPKKKINIKTTII